MGGALDPAVARGRNLVRDNLSDLRPGDRVTSAVSGGADSLALAVVGSFVTERLGLAFSAIVVDHQLQAGSETVAQRVVEQLGELGIEVHVVTVEVGSVGGMEAAARAARYTALEAVESDAILLGHTLNDQAETVLLGLGRGSGLRSIAGMSAVNGRRRRPFLGVTREETEQMCRASGLDWWEDPQNSDPSFTRVRLRREAIPLLEEILGGGVAGALARTADMARTDNACLDRLAGAEASDLRIGQLEQHHPAVRRRVLRLAAIAAGADASQLTSGHIGAMDELITNWRGQQRIELPGGVSALRSGYALTFASTPVAP